MCDSLAWLEDAERLSAFLEARLPAEEILSSLQSLHPDALTLEALKQLHHAIWQRRHPDFHDMPNKPCVLLDTCGTGGSGIEGYNTSTTVAIVLASMGVFVLKFGNRAATSHSGSFDFLEALGLQAPLPNEKVFPLLEETGLSFLMAGQVYPDLVKLAPFRKACGHPTAFNFLGPLLNPTLPTHRVLGCANAQVLPLLGQYLEEERFKNEYSLLVRAENGLDEAHPDFKNKGLYIRGQSRPLMLEILPLQVKITESLTKEGFSATENVKRFDEILDGRDASSLTYWQVVLNSALAWQLLHPKESLNTALQKIEETLASRQTKTYWQHFQNTIK